MLVVEHGIVLKFNMFVGYTIFFKLLPYIFKLSQLNYIKLT